MQKKFEAPALTVVGPAAEVVMGSGIGTNDFGTMQVAADFEFEQD